MSLGNIRKRWIICGRERRALIQEADLLCSKLASWDSLPGESDNAGPSEPFGRILLDDYVENRQGLTQVDLITEEECQEFISRVRDFQARWEKMPFHEESPG